MSCLFWKLDRLPAFLLATVILLVISGCGGSGSDAVADDSEGASGGSGSEGESPSSPDEPEEYVGLIPKSEFDLVRPPTYGEFLEIYEVVVADSPSLLLDKDLLAKEIFDRVKSSDSSVGTRYIDRFNRLTKEEWLVVLLNPIDAYGANSTVDAAQSAAIEKFPCDREVSFADGKADALRHSYWNALMARETNPSFARDFATAHESVSNSEAAKRMDLHNNAHGRQVAAEYPDATDSEILEILLNAKYVYIEGMTDIPEDTDGLVYFKNREKYDTQMSGYLTNPDSGVTWDVVYYFTQCGPEIRGQYHITYNQYFQWRWFSGVIEENESTLELNVEFPYSRLGPPSSSACRDVVMNFALNEDSMSGTWSSSNCPLGGEINISR